MPITFTGQMLQRVREALVMLLGSAREPLRQQCATHFERSGLTGVASKQTQAPACRHPCPGMEHGCPGPQSRIEAACGDPQVVDGLIVFEGPAALRGRLECEGSAPQWLG
jgi:hypothetical protein